LVEVYIKISYNTVKEKSKKETSKMDNRNIYQQPTQPLPNYFSYGMYPAAATTYARPEMPAYMMPQATSTLILKGRPVTSFEEARVAQIDLDGSIFIFPDLGNKRIYTKRINADGTAALYTYTLEEKPVEVINIEPVSRDEFNELKKTLEALVAQLS
jgi:hypothetical protein